ncbi:MAG: division/cell wall cluster transcriptional repressor MraZ [Acidobacteria bacterium]|nr:division/cell wall cluster transcriptional repressor MraZ [Acidobacteriota bacterium]
MDPKGRLKIPTAFKTFLDENYGREFFVTSFEGESVKVYPFPEWEKIEEKLAALPSTDKHKRRFLDRVNYWGQTVQMDGQGRILIPVLLRESAGMKGEVAVIGHLKHLEVWNMERFREHLEREPLTDDDFEALSNLGI